MTVVRGIEIEKRYLIGKSDQIFPCIYTLLFHLPRKTLVKIYIT